MIRIALKVLAALIIALMPWGKKPLLTPLALCLSLGKNTK